MEPYERSRLWQKALHVQDNDPDAQNRERLRQAFKRMRDSAGVIASKIVETVPDLTIHDLSHIDAMWETADDICGESATLTPTEAFILGGSFLLHDLGLSSAAHGAGVTSSARTPEWCDLIAMRFLKTRHRHATQEEIVNPPEDVRRDAEFTLLREKHAEQARILAVGGVETSDGQKLFLVEDHELRTKLAPVMGDLAASHWLNVDQLTETFPVRALSSLPSLPREWKIDRLKLACILRLADATQIDSRRAPALLRAIHRPSAASATHWEFQSRIERPEKRDDKLIYSTLQPFEGDVADAWWLGYDMLRMVDAELRRVDALLYDLDLPRLAIRGVAGVETPDRFQEYVRTDGWLPIGAVIQVSNVPRLVRDLGGQALYGSKPWIALRELVQNGGDAVTARAHLDKPVQQGRVLVRLRKEVEDWFLEVEDDGIGMSSAVLRKILLDFSSSLWDSDLLRQEHEGLASSSWRPLGRYGIGFYSVFMLGENVKVTTNRYDAGRASTLVLEFKDGIVNRPLMRKAERHEEILHGGTLVSVKLRTHPFDLEQGLLAYTQVRDWDLRTLCVDLFPAIEFNLDAQGPDDAEPVRLVEGGDWRTIPATTLFRRLYNHSRPPNITDDRFEAGELIYAERERRIERDGELLARLAYTDLSAYDHHAYTPLSAKIVAGGISAGSFMPANGVVLGTPATAARSQAMALVSQEEIASWAKTQAEYVLADRARVGEWDEFVSATVMRNLGATHPYLSFVLTNEGLLTYREFLEWAPQRESLKIVDGDDVGLNTKDMVTITVFDNDTGGIVELADDVVISSAGDIARPSPLLGRSYDRKYKPNPRQPLAERDWKAAWYRVGQGTVGDVIKALAVCWDCAIENLASQLPPPRPPFVEKLLAIGTDQDGDEVLAPAISIFRNPSRKA